MNPSRLRSRGRFQPRRQSPRRQPPRRFRYPPSPKKNRPATCYRQGNSARNSPRSSSARCPISPASKYFRSGRICSTSRSSTAGPMTDNPPILTSAFAGRSPPPAPFGEAIAKAAARGRLIVQPRMGMGDPVDMRAGLLAVKAANASTAGTITVDSYTRGNDDEAVRRAMARDGQLNGYPIVTHSSDVTSAIVKELRDASFVIQVRHGSANPRRIFEAVVAAGLDATEGGPISYCLPYTPAPCRGLGEELGGVLPDLRPPARQRIRAASRNVRRLYARPALPT